VSRLRRVPIRTRLALGFALVMAAVLATVGTFVYAHTRSDLDRQIDRELDARIASVVAIVRDDGDDLGDPEEAPLDRVDTSGVVQVLRGAGDVADATSDSVADRPLVTGSVLADLRSGAIDHADVDSPLGRLRVVAERTQDDGVRYVTLAGASLEERDQALSSLSRLLLIGGPVALLLASLAAYGVATAALRPVEAMRRAAARISIDEPGKRLPVAPGEDELSRLGTTLNALLARLEKALESERRFAADASHELRTPLSILRNEVELALAAERSPEELRVALESIGEEVERLIRLSRDLLALARADEGGMALEREDVDLAELSRRVAAGPARGAASVEIPKPLRARVDPIKLEQAIGNLVDNALLHGAPPVTIAGERSNGAVVLRVRDGGAGFDEDLAGRATDRFARGPRARSMPGSGLGLSIVEAIVAAHGGTVSIATDDGPGAEVALVLPDPPVGAP
jgi:signal transduction histidine kinase